MWRSIPRLGSGPLRALGAAVVVAGLAQDLTAAEPSRRPWRPVPPRGRFFGPPALPSPIPIPLPVPFQFQLPNPLVPGLPESGVTGPTDRCLVVPGPIDPRSLHRVDTASIDPGIYAEPRVQGLPIRPSGWRFGR